MVAISRASTAGMAEVAVEHERPDIERLVTAAAAASAAIGPSPSSK